MLHFVKYIDLKPVQIQRQMIRLDFWIEVDEATLRISMQHGRSCHSQLWKLCPPTGKGNLHLSVNNRAESLAGMQVNHVITFCVHKGSLTQSHTSPPSAGLFSRAVFIHLSYCCNHTGFL